MSEDLHQTFAEIFPNPQDLKAQIAEILPHVRSREYDKAPNFTFLAIEQTPSEVFLPSQITSSEDESESSYEDESFSSETYKEEDYLRSFNPEDAEDPDLKLTLFRTDHKMYSTSKKYLAVSYCWPSPNDNLSDFGALNLPVTIKELDGSNRPSRAHPHIIRRAIRHAADLGIKYIWIDQESINQDDSEEKQAAIQSMDYVYRHANQVLCLLHLQFKDQKIIDLLESLHYHNRYGVRGKFNSMLRHIKGLRGSPGLAHALADVLCLISKDRWFTRAWIMHERLCSSDLASTVVWASCAPDLLSNVRGEVALIGKDQSEDAQEVAYRLEHGEPKEETEERDPDDEGSDVERDDELSLWEEYGKEECLEAARRLREATSHFEIAIKLISPAVVRRRLADSPRFFFSPLQITHFLAPLGCFYPSDKIAMLCNTCQWTKRLDTRKIDDNGWSFSLCIWILAIANSDASFFCTEQNCKTNGLADVAAWAPHAETKIGPMHCSGLLDFVSMHLQADGLHTSGWLWETKRFIDLTDLIDFINEIDKNVPETTKSGWVEYEFKTWPVEDNATMLKEFFWALLLKLFALKEYEIANLVWEATKLRYRGGFYGRSLQTIPIATFDKIVDPATKQYIGCYDSLQISKENEEDDLYLSWGPIAPSVIRYLRTNCAHCRNSGRWNDLGHDEAEEDNEKTKSSERHSYALLGGEEQLGGLEWIRTAVLTNGGLSVGEFIPGKRLERASEDGDDSNLSSADEASKSETLPPPPIFALLDRSRTESTASHIFALHREVRKYKKGDGKALHLLHPFDVWLKDKFSHTDAPFCWTASRDESGGIQTHKPANALFDIGKIKRTGYIFSWPDAYSKESWT